MQTNLHLLLLTIETLKQDKMKAQKFQTKKEARKHTEEARKKGLDFSTKKFATKRKFQFFSGNHWQWLEAIS